MKFKGTHIHAHTPTHTHTHTHTHINTLTLAHTVHAGGKLFENYVLMLGSFSSTRDFKKLLADKLALGAAGESTFVDHDSFEVIIARESNAFVGFLLFSFGRISKDCKKQLFFSTLSATHHGLSNYGHELQAQLGFMQKSTTFSSLREKTIEDAKQKARYAMRPMR